MRRYFVVALLALIGCVKPDTGDDAGTDEDDAGATEYTGPATSNVIPEFDPDFDAGGNQLIDAGSVVVDTTCCETTFNLPSGDEPSFAEGVLRGSAAPLTAGVSLTSLGADAGWAASICMPLNSSQNYWFEFTWDAGLPDFGDAGPPIDEDGGGR